MRQSIGPGEHIGLDAVQLILAQIQRFEFGQQRQRSARDALYAIVGQVELPQCSKTHKHGHTIQLIAFQRTVEIKEMV